LISTPRSGVVDTSRGGSPERTRSSRQAPTLVDYQLPEGLRPLGTNAVIAAVSCQTGRGPIFPGFFNQSPDLLADGSVGLVRLV
jgi:hypothetical protein